MSKFSNQVVPSSIKSVRNTARRFGTIMMGLLLASCQTNGDQNLSNFTIFGAPQKLVPGEDVVLPRNHAALSQHDGVESTLRLVVELDQQKRFAEARHLLTQVRDAQPKEGEGYNSVTSSLAILAIKEGNFDAFKRLARQLDTSLGKPIRVEHPHTEIITLFRSVTGATLPVNAPEGMKTLKDKYVPVLKAQNQRSNDQ